MPTLPKSSGAVPQSSPPPDLPSINFAHHPLAAPRTTSLRLTHLLLLLSTITLFALHFVRLSADFPNFSRWMDWSKYTDEGWYGDAAIRHFLLGHWYVPGDFNPAVALPVWPLLETALFHFTGVSLIAVRALTVSVFGGILVAAWVLIAHSEGRDRAPRSTPTLAASIAVLLLAANPFCFVFTRLAILEPLLILLMLLALLAAQSARLTATGLLRANLAPILALGLILPLLILTKTTGLFLVPAIAWLLFASFDYRWRPFLQVGCTAAGIALALWLTYFLAFVRPHYLLDYRYLFSANAYTHITRENYVSVLQNTFTDGKWFGLVLYLSALAAVALSFASLRRLRACPIIPTLILWAGGYAAFLAWHNNLQPRYYLVVAIPLTLLVPVALRDLVVPRLRTRSARIFAACAAAALFAAIVIPDTVQTVSILRNPQYTLLGAFRQIHDYILADQRQHPTRSPLVLSISGSDLSLMTGLHSICDDFGTAELADRVKQYNPGWYLSWNLIEDDKMDALTPQFQVDRVATFPAMDDQDRNVLILYRLTPAELVSGARGSRRRGKLGQKPSTSQLKH